MPRAMIEMLAGRTIEQKRLMAKEVCAALADLCGVPLSETFVRFVDLPFENFATNRELRSVISERNGKPSYGAPEDPRVTIFYKEGPTLDRRRAFVSRAAEKIALALKLPIADITIFMLESKKTELVRGGVFASDKG